MVWRNAGASNGNSAGPPGLPAAGKPQRPRCDAIPSSRRPRFGNWGLAVGIDLEFGPRTLDFPAMRPLALLLLLTTAARALDPSALRAAAEYSAANRGTVLLVHQHGHRVFAATANGGSLSARGKIYSGTKMFWILAALAAEQEMPGDDDFLAAPVGEFDVGDFVVGEVGGQCRGAHKVGVSGGFTASLRHRTH